MVCEGAAELLGKRFERHIFTTTMATLFEQRVSWPKISMLASDQKISKEVVPSGFRLPNTSYVVVEVIHSISRLRVLMWTFKIMFRRRLLYWLNVCVELLHYSDVKPFERAADCVSSSTSTAGMAYPKDPATVVASRVASRHERVQIKIE